MTRLHLLPYNQGVIDQAVRHLMHKFSPSGKKIGTMAIASIFIEAWDLYSIVFILIFLKDIYEPSSFMLGLTAAATQLGALFGALIGGWLADRIGRRKVFIATMVVFVVLGLAQAFVPNMLILAALRFLLGIPLGSDLSAGFSYIMEAMSKGAREVMANSWQLMFAVGELVAIISVTILYATGVEPDLLWRIILGMGAIPAFVLLLARINVPDTAIWLIQKGHFEKAKVIAREMYDDDLAMLPDADMDVPQGSLRRYFTVIFSSPLRRRATLFSWLAGGCQAMQFQTFGLYLPIIFAMIGVSSITGNNLLTAAIFCVGVVSAYAGPKLLPRLEHRGISQWGFGLVFVGLMTAAFGIAVGLLLLVPLAAAVLTFGHYWSAQNFLTIGSMVAPVAERGLATGIAYAWTKVPSFCAILLFPIVFDAIGLVPATVLVSAFSLVGFLSARYLLPEVYGYVDTEETAAPMGQPVAH
jgi:MFS family permease